MTLRLSLSGSGDTVRRILPWLVALAARRGCRLQVRQQATRPRTTREARALAREVCRPFGGGS